MRTKRTKPSWIMNLFHTWLIFFYNINEQKIIVQWKAVYKCDWTHFVNKTANVSYVAILLLKGIRCSANSLWQKYNTKYKNHFDHLSMFSLAGQCISMAGGHSLVWGKIFKRLLDHLGRKEGHLGVIKHWYRVKQQR